MAAINHDLRTPITSMRLRAEYLEDPAEKEKFIASLDEMQSMTEATLAFARDDATAEPTRMIDLSALVESLCSDLLELGWEVTVVEAPRTPLRCRPNAVRRALRNVMENAVRYGARAHVSLTIAATAWILSSRTRVPGSPSPIASEFSIHRCDLKTPGIATGGVGLGLSIARSILRSHGGDISLGEGSGGLRVCLHFPGVEA